MTHLNILANLAEKSIKVVCKERNLRIESPQGSLTQQDKNELSINKELIIGVFDKYKIESNFDISNLSDQQLGIWYIDNLNGSSTEYNIVTRYTQHGDLDISILQECFRILINRHDVLKTNVLVDNENIPWQIVNNSHQFSIDLIDIEISDEVPETVFERYEDKEYERKFDLSSDLLIHVSSLSCNYNGDKYKALIINIHHLVFDGWSLDIFINELSKLYNALVNSVVHKFDPQVINYRDFSRWQKRLLQSDAIEKEKSYWKKQLTEIPQVHSLPLDFPRPAVLGNSGSSYRESISIQLDNKISEFAQTNKSSIFVTWYAIFSLFISRLSNNRDIVVGTAVANREAQHTKELVGLFINTVALRMQLPESIHLTEAILKAKEIVNQSYAHQSIPLRLMIEQSKVSPSLSYSPLYQVNFSYANVYPIRLENAVLTPIPYKTRYAKFDLSLTVEKSDNSATINWEFNNDLFSKESIECISKSFVYFTEKILNRSHFDVFKQDICHPEYQERINSYNSTINIFEKPRFFFQELERISSKQPDSIAIFDKNRSYSYDELNRYSNRIAHYLKNEFNISSDQVIAVCLDRNIQMVAVMLAVMKAGAAYMPIDPNFPRERLQYMLDDAKTKCLITAESLLQSMELAHDNCLLISSNETVNKIAQSVDCNIEQDDLSDRRLAYVIYTSGSTGKPKGVMIEHRSLSNFLYSMQAKPGMASKDRLLAVTSTSFDIHILELFLPLICGASLVIADAESAKNPADLINMIETYQINILQATPTSWQMLFDAGWEVKEEFKALCGGEALNDRLLDSFLSFKKIELWNMYGPTETTVWSAVKAVTRSITLGNPIANTQLFLLDDALNPVPPGCVAQLYIGGYGLARGYLNSPELTQEKFIESVRIGNKLCRLYKTGDLCAQNADGEIRFIGRIDTQVKIRGFRIELAEIERVISKSGYVNDVCVVVKQFDNSKFICAYIIRNQMADNRDDISALRAYLLQNLPDYMIPSRIEILEQFPETPNRKINRKLLIDRPIDKNTTNISEKLCEKDQVLIDTMCEVLALEPGSLTIDDNFYYVGGDSITALRYVAAVKRKGYTFSAQDLIKCQCVRSLSPYAIEYIQDSTSQKLFTGSLDLTLDHKYILSKEKLVKNFTINGLMSLPALLDIGVFKQAFMLSTINHEIVRSKVKYENDSWYMEILNPTDNFYIGDYYLNSGWESEDTGSQLASILSNIQNKLSLNNGIHYAFSLISSIEEKQKLMFTVNHSLIDGYSNGIFLEDLFYNYHKLLNSESVSKTSLPSIDMWYSAIKNYINSSSFKTNIDYWKNSKWDMIRYFPSDFNTTIPESQITHETSAFLTEKLGSDFTNVLKKDVPDVLNISHLDFIMAMIALTLHEEAKLPAVYLHVIDSGRTFYNEVLKDHGIDMSRTVSSLSELIPKFFIFDEFHIYDDIDYIINFSQKLRKKNEYSQTFKLLKYGIADQDICKAMNKFPEPDILLNFLGINDVSKINENNRELNGHLPSISKYNSLINPVTVPGDAPLERRLFLAWHVIDEQLEMNWHYSQKLNTEDSISKISKACKVNIERALNSIKSVKEKRFSKNHRDIVSKAFELNHDN